MRKRATRRSWRRLSNSSRPARHPCPTKKRWRSSPSWMRHNGAGPRAALHRSYASRFMPNLLEGKTAVIAGIANKWSLAYGIAESFAREGASLVLTYLNEKQREAIASIVDGFPVLKMLPCDVSKDEEIEGLANGLRDLGKP